MRLRLALAFACVFAPPAMAENRAFLLGTQSYGEKELTAAGDISDAAEALEAAGFEVFSGVDLKIDALREGLGSLLTSQAPERSVILLTGRFATSGRSSWYLPAETAELTLATIDGEALSLSTVMQIAGRSPGGALVLLGYDLPEDAGAGDDAVVTFGTGLMPGVGMVDPPQGVTVVSGGIPDILNFTEETLVLPGLSLPDMLDRATGLEAYGFLSPLVTFLPHDDAVPDTEASDDADAAAEREVWQAARDADTIREYEAYLSRYPGGAFADQARAAIAALTRDPERVEAALELGSAARRQIQRNLTLLDYDTRGVDGIFGPGSRNAISNWQKENGFEATGFLTAEQVVILNQMAATRQAELEEQRREQALERERADRAYWEDIGRGQDEAGLRAYLERFPDGLFSDVASARLSEIEASRDREAWQRAQAENTAAAYRRYLDAHEDGAFAGRARARLAEMGEAELRAADEAAWNAARQTDTADAYARYLDSFPEGAFAERAAGRLADLTEEEAPDQDAISQEQARQAEAQLRLNSISRGLIEAQLRAQGFSTGPVDGQFDGTTRQALRNYQEARGLSVTGYVDSPTLNRLIADGLPLSR